MQVAVPLTLLGRTREIKDVLQPHLPLVERLADPQLSARFFLSLTLAADHTADHDAAEAFGARAIEEAHRSQDRITEGRALVLLAFSSLWVSEHRRGVERARRAVEFLEAPAEAFWRGHALYLESQLLLLLGELEPAHRAAEAARTLGRMITDRRIEAYGTIMLAIEMMIRGDTAGALQGAKQALEIAADPLARAHVQGYLGEIATQAGETATAMQNLTAAVEFSRTAHFRQLEAWELARLAEADFVVGDLSRAQAVAQEAADLAEIVDFPYVQGRAAHVRGQVALATGVVPEALVHLRSAVEIFTRIEAPYEWGSAMLAFADAQAASGDVQDATRVRAEAAETAKRIGAKLPTLKAMPMT